jgi:hypothetical protein
LERGIIAPRVYHKSFELYIFGLVDDAIRLDQLQKLSARGAVGEDTGILARVGYTFRTLRDHASSMNIV